MKKLLGTLSVFALAAGPPVFAHRATERYIPIGSSPGVSGKLTLIGTVEPRAETDSIIRIRTEDDRVVGFTWNESTRFWLDRTRVRRTNVPASWEHCREGRRVEVRFRDDDPTTGIAAWVKVEADGE